MEHKIKKTWKELLEEYSDGQLKGVDGAMGFDNFVRLFNDIKLFLGQETFDICEKCSSLRKTTEDGERYLCNHFSEICGECEEWKSNEEEVKIVGIDFGIKESLGRLTILPLSSESNEPK